MEPSHIDLDPVSLITVGTEGPPGQRTFFLQAAQGTQVVTMIIEKAQAVVLAESIDRLLTSAGQDDSAAVDEAEATAPGLALLQPLAPAFRVVEMGLGVDEEREMIVLVALEAPSDEPGQRVRCAASYDQVRLLARRCRFLADQGRPICPLCGRPIDPGGHFCPRSNGHARPAD
jgi:uncharacterized repeat protein (TIGR03847 family)